MAKTEADLPAVEAYLAAVPEPAKSTLEKTRAMIRKLVPAEAVERIGYGMPGFYYKGPLIWYAAAKEHCALYPTPWPIEVLAEELKNYSVSKGTIRFDLEKPMPATLMKKIVKLQVERNERKAKG
ncbi:MAG: DUF1801 domain-containing protein [Candidatus Solibacter sp.]